MFEESHQRSRLGEGVVLGSLVSSGTARPLYTNTRRRACASGSHRQGPAVCDIPRHHRSYSSAHASHPGSDYLDAGGHAAGGEEASSISRGRWGHASCAVCTYQHRLRLSKLDKSLAEPCLVCASLLPAHQSYAQHRQPAARQQLQAGQTRKAERACACLRLLASGTMMILSLRPDPLKGALPSPQILSLHQHPPPTAHRPAPIFTSTTALRPANVAATHLRIRPRRTLQIDCSAATTTPPTTISHSQRPPRSPTTHPRTQGARTQSRVYVFVPRARLCTRSAA